MENKAAEIRRDRESRQETRKGRPRAEAKMAQQLGAMAALPEDQNSLPRTHTVPHNCL